MPQKGIEKNMENPKAKSWVAHESWLKRLAGIWNAALVNRCLGRPCQSLCQNSCLVLGSRQDSQVTGRAASPTDPTDRFLATPNFQRMLRVSKNLR
jgi:hypothetical protein